MALETSCPHCNQPYQLPDSQDGKQVRCRVCGQTFHVRPCAPALPRRPDRDDPRPSRPRRRRRKGLRVALVGGFVGLAALFIGFWLYRAWNRGDIGGADTPDRGLVGRWVDPEQGTTFEFRRDGTFRRESNRLFADAMLPGSGTYKFLEDNLVEIRPAPELGIRLPPWVVEVYIGPEELRVFVGGRVTQDIRKPWHDGYLTFHMRRDGKSGPLPAGKGIGGSAEDLRQRVRGRWRYEHECWEFTADDKLVRPYLTYTSACRYVDGKTIELTDKGGKHALEVYCGKDQLRVLHFNVDEAGKRLPPSIVSPNMLVATRIPDDDHDDDPLPGDPKVLIVGEWQFQQPSTTKGMPGPVLRFDREGRYARVITDGGDGSKTTIRRPYLVLPNNEVQVGEKRILPEGVNEIDPPKFYRVLFTKKQLALIDLNPANRHFQDGSGKLRYIELPEIYRRVAAGGN